RRELAEDRAVVQRELQALAVFVEQPRAGGDSCLAGGTGDGDAKRGIFKPAAFHAWREQPRVVENVVEISRHQRRWEEIRRSQVRLAHLVDVKGGLLSFADQYHDVAYGFLAATIPILGPPQCRGLEFLRQLREDRLQLAHHALE